MRPSISVLGTGLMGSALVRALRTAEYPVVAWNRTRARAEPLAECGARIADSVADAVAASDIVITNVLDYGSTRSLLEDEAVAAELDGTLLIELTSGSPDEAREATAWAESHGARWLDGAVLATPDLIGTREAALVISGDPDAFAEAEPALEALGEAIHVGTAAGHANAVDAAVLSMMWGGLFGVLHAIAVGQAEGVDLEMLEARMPSAFAVIGQMATDLARRTAAGRFDADEETLSTVLTHAGALGHLRAVMDASGIDPAVVNGYGHFFGKAEAAGRLDADFAAMSTFMKAAD